MDTTRNVIMSWPAEVFYDERLSQCDCFVFAQIKNLDNGNGCYASNEFLKKICKCEKRALQYSISRLKELEYIEIEGNGKHRVIRVKGANNAQIARDKGAKYAPHPCKICTDDWDGNSAKYAPNYSNNISNSKRKHTKKKEDIDLDSDYIKKIQKEKSEALRLLYNEHRGNMPPCEVISPKMMSTISQLIDLYGEEKVRAVIIQAERNKFLQGALEGATFIAQFGWLINPENAQKVLNGNYAKWQEPPKTKEEQDWDDLWDKIAGKR